MSVTASEILAIGPRRLLLLLMGSAPRPLPPRASTALLLDPLVDGRYPNQKKQLMENIPIKKSTRSGERQHQAMSAQQRVIPGHYNPLEEVGNTNKLEKSYFMKNNTSSNRVDSNAIISAMEARTSAV